MRRSPILLALPAVAALGCGNSREVLAVTDPCAVPLEVSAVPIAVGGIAPSVHQSPPTLRLEQDGSALRAELAFSGVIRQGGTGRVRGRCVELSFPARAGTSEPALSVFGQLQLATGQLRIALADGPAFTLVRRPAGQ